MTIVSGNWVFNRLTINGLGLTLFFVPLLPERRFGSGKPAWLAYCPDLVEQGTSTFSKTKEEALENIREVLEMTLTSLIEHGEHIPVHPIEEDKPLDSQVLVTV